ncbi:ly6/PLAUR domain-containing protein 6-like [Mytilus trossulus]|uniref:ly6/PLAUR domain-containing protein 6-like n=1 Tax=Mytilus trossulus TaxID=6551 RepID=UPI00300612E5
MNASLLSDIFLFVALVMGMYACKVSSHFVVTATQKTNHGLTCWTCPEMYSNQECNDWAPDIPCPQNKTTCATLHRFNTSSKVSIRVTKSCVFPLDCDESVVGCITRDGATECTSCCTESYCNKHIPTDDRSASQLTSNSISSAPSLPQNSGLYLTLIVHCLSLLICI